MPDTSQVNLLLYEQPRENGETLAHALTGLGSEYHLETGRTQTEIINKLTHTRFNVVMICQEILFSASTGHLLTALHTNYSIPVVVLVDDANRELGEQAVLKGAHDYLFVRYLSDTELFKKLVAKIISETDYARELTRARENQYKLANYDVVTRLPNRFLFYERMTNAVVTARRSQGTFVLCLVNLDRFRNVNEAYSRGAGDEVLRACAARMQELVGQRGTVAHLGGDEFAMILHDMEMADRVPGFTEQVIESLSRPIQVGHQLCTIGVSIGVVRYPEDGGYCEQLNKRADSALREAKKTTGNHCYFYNVDMGRRAEHQLAIETALAKAIKTDSDELSLAFQPRFAFEGGEIESAEALLRWNCDKLGAIGPSEFVPIAEESNLIGILDEWALNAVCRQIKDWHRRGHTPPRIAVNVSAHTFSRADFLDMVTGVLERTGCNGGCLEIEITEGSLLRDLDFVRRQLLALTALKISVAIDDFGTGFSSLNYLRRLPFDTLKIDASFICDEHSDAKAKAILRAIISLGFALELGVLAEGIETKAQLEFLQAQGCQFGQGYYFSKPLSSSAFEKKFFDYRVAI